VALPVNSSEVDWNAVKRVLARIGESHGDFLQGNILIGGAAAWFYRGLLEFSQDKDFSAPHFSEQENRVWISKDIDFIGTRREEIAARLGIPTEGDPPAPRIDGIWIDSPNEGLFLTCERALVCKGGGLFQVGIPEPCHAPAPRRCGSTHRKKR
jgi:hypothetical protein